MQTKRRIKKRPAGRTGEKKTNSGWAPQGLSFLPMNLPNQLTLLRVCLIPIFVLFLLLPLKSNAGRYIALAVFIIASLTDLLDGMIARRYELITDFGKFMDPLADKILVCSAMVCLVAKKELAAWIVIIILAREFIISGFRLVAADKGIVIAANIWGKMKTVAQMVMVILLLLDLPGVFHVITQIVVYIALLLTIISLVDYIWQNRAVLTEGGM